MLSMRLSKEEQTLQRRAEVWKLYSQNKTQQEIADEMEKFHISQQTVSRDLAFLKQDAANFVKENRKYIAEEYAKVMSNFEQLRKEAWKQFNKANDDSNIKIALYDKLLDINNNIMNLLSVGDMIDIELTTLKSVGEHADKIREELKTTTTVNRGGSRNGNQAKF
jgi:hypothetical protein